MPSVAQTVALPQGAEAANVVVPVNIRRSLMLAQLEAGAVTAEDAWDTGVLTLDDVVAEVEQKGLLKDRKREKLRDALLKLLAQHGAERWLTVPSSEAAPTSPVSSSPPSGAPGSAVPSAGVKAQAKPLNLDVHLAVADYLSRAGDPRALAVYETVLQRVVQIKDQAPPMNEVSAVLHLANHYARNNELQKAIDTLLDGKKYSPSPYWSAVIGVEGARVYRLMGDAKKAEELSQQVARAGSGWLTGMALWDRANALVAKGQYVEAERLLRQPVKGEGAERIEVGLLALQSYCFYRMGQLDKARETSRQAMLQYESLDADQRRGRVESQAAKAQGTLEWAYRFSKDSFVIQPDSLRVIVPDGAVKDPLVRQVLIRTMRPSVLTVTSDTPQVQARVVAPSVDKSFYTEYALEVTIAPEAFQKTAQAELTVSSPGQGQKVLKVALAVGHTNTERLKRADEQIATQGKDKQE